jgi:hypothetical protein
MVLEAVFFGAVADVRVKIQIVRLPRELKDRQTHYPQEKLL